MSSSVSSKGPVSNNTRNAEAVSLLTFSSKRYPGSYSESAEARVQVASWPSITKLIPTLSFRFPDKTSDPRNKTFHTASGSDTKFRTWALRDAKKAAPFNGGKLGTVVKGRGGTERLAGRRAERLAAGRVEAAAAGRGEEAAAGRAEAAAAGGGVEAAAGEGEGVAGGGAEVAEGRGGVEIALRL